jgi:N-acetylglucosamine kinase-like BadF-type ATPase
LTQDRYAIGAQEAPLVFAAAEAGDAVANAVIVWCAEELASLANGVIRQLQLEEEAFDVVLVGSLYNGGSLFTEPLFAAIRAVARAARFVRLDAPPVVGAVIIGMEAAGVPSAPLRRTLIASTKRIEERVTA